MVVATNGSEPKEQFRVLQEMAMHGAFLIE
jgi:hypothetical protein